MEKAVHGGFTLARAGTGAAFMPVTTKGWPTSASWSRTSRRLPNTISSEEFQARLTKSKLAFGAINGVEDINRHDAFRTAPFTNALGEEMLLPAQPVISSGAAESKTLKSPAVGEHTDSVIKEFMAERA